MTNREPVIIGDQRDGIEIRYRGDEVDEVVAWVGSEALLHIEAMDTDCVWMCVTTASGEARIWLRSKKRVRMHVEHNE